MLKISVYGIINLVSEMATYTNMSMRPNTLCMTSPFLPLIEIFCFAIILKYVGSHILELCGSTLKERCALIKLVKPSLMHLG